MEILKWVKKNYGDGYGDGSGSGYGSGDGYGSGYSSGNGSSDGDGDGYGSGSGSGSGYGSGYSSGSGYGSGNGYGSSSGDGDGDGYGSGYRVNGKNIFNIDGIPSVIKKVKNNIATGFIVSSDLSLEKSFIVKSQDSKYFAHGETLKKAFESLQYKIFEEIDIEEKIELFFESYYSNCLRTTGRYFFEWHGKLTGSCEQGREYFVKNKNIDLDKKMSIEKFIELTKNEYGGEVIRQIKEQLK